MSDQLDTDKQERRYGTIALAGLITMSIGLLASAGTYAGLSARATGAESVSSGTLNLTLSPDVGVGFSNFTGKMAPGDTDNVYVNLNNTGTLASAAGMTLTVTGLPSTSLTNGSVAGEGLTVTAAKCSVAWTLATGVCPGVTTPILAVTRVSLLAVPRALANIPALAATIGRVAHVQVKLGLVATETSKNGVTPVATIQGLTATLHFVFTERQRAAIATRH